MSAAVLLTLLSTAATPAAAEALLLENLRRRYPAVTRWEVRPLGDQPPLNAAGVSIVLLGARSAVRIGSRVYWYAVSGFQRALSAARPIGFGRALDGHDAVAGERDVLAAGCEPLTETGVLNGKRARRSIALHDVICASAVEPRPLVSRGDEVTVTYVGAKVVLTTKGIAEKDGAAGETLPIRNPRSHEVFRAVVSGPGEVTLHE